MTVSEKHMASAYEILIAAGAEYFNTYYDEGEPGELYENGLVASIAPHVAAALAAAEREGREDERRRCAEIARQAVIRDADDYWDKCNVAATVAESILSQANTHSVALPPPSATEAGSVQPSADPATHHASRNGEGA